MDAGGDLAELWRRCGGDIGEIWRRYLLFISLHLPVSPCISPTQAEAAKREQWMAEKTKEIKDSTVRGLEPDIQRLVAKQREEVRREIWGDVGRLGEI